MSLRPIRLPCYPLVPQPNGKPIASGDSLNSNVGKSIAGIYFPHVFHDVFGHGIAHDRPVEFTTHER
jgi:hypothetical protein